MIERLGRAIETFILTVFAITLVGSGAVFGQALLLNEVEGDAPDPANQFSCQYVELLGTPGAVVPTNVYFVSINGASASFGDVSFIVSLGGRTVGQNGTITIINDIEGTCPGRTFPAGTTIVAVQDFDGLGLIDGGARTFAIITAPTMPLPGDDIDTNNDRIIDPANGVVVLDGFGFTTNDTFHATYAPNIFNAVVDGAPGTILLPDAATRLPGNTTPMSGVAWYYGELAGSPANTTQYSGAPQSLNFPAGGELTPGAPNVPGVANTPPNAVDDAVTVAEGSGAIPINVLDNDTDPDAGQTINISAVTQGANGSVINNVTSLTYQPNPTFFGTDTFTYTVSDGNGGSDSATVTVTVTPAAMIAIHGRVLTNLGRPISSATVYISGPAGTGYYRTNTLGYFHFAGVRTGATYTIATTARRYSFQSVQVTPIADISDLIITGIP